jgi:hypothetical protein
MGPPPKTTGQQVHMWLSHPLLLLVVGAIVTGVLVPSFTGKWQRNVTAQDMKTQVIGDVTTAVSIPMTQLSVNQNPVFANGGNAPQVSGSLPQVSGNAPQANQSTIAGTYAAFLTKSDSVDSEINAYFPENKIPTHWDNLVGLLQNFYLFTYANNPGLKQQYLHNIKHYFDVHHTSGGINWGLLANGSWHDHGYYRTWQALERKILGVKTIVLTGIMDAPAPSF